jgi:hypothetical protein
LGDNLLYEIFGSKTNRFITDQIVAMSWSLKKLIVDKYKPVYGHTRRQVENDLIFESLMFVPVNKTWPFACK